ncbi:MAG: hypothetical protein ACO3EW_04830, partial [Candidatus Nanopelagicaceae bacterium]
IFQYGDHTGILFLEFLRIRPKSHAVKSSSIYLANLYLLLKRLPFTTLAGSVIVAAALPSLCLTHILRRVTAILISFYWICWSIVDEDLLAACKNAFNRMLASAKKHVRLLPLMSLINRMQSAAFALPGVFNSSSSSTISALASLSVVLM